MSTDHHRCFLYQMLCALKYVHSGASAACDTYLLLARAAAALLRCTAPPLEPPLLAA
jgi:hypothetical protein